MYLDMCNVELKKSRVAGTTRLKNNRSVVGACMAGRHDHDHMVYQGGACMAGGVHGRLT